MTDERGNNYIETIKDFTPRKNSIFIVTMVASTGSFDDCRK